MRNAIGPAVLPATLPATTRGRKGYVADLAVGNRIPGEEFIVSYVKEVDGEMQDIIGVSSGPVQHGQSLLFTGVETLSHTPVNVSGNFKLIFNCDLAAVDQQISRQPDGDIDYVRYNGTYWRVLLGATTLLFTGVTNRSGSCMLERSGTDLTMTVGDQTQTLTGVPTANFTLQVANPAGSFINGSLWGMELYDGDGSLVFFLPGISSDTTSIPALPENVVVSGATLTSFYATRNDGTGFDLNQLGYSERENLFESSEDFTASTWDDRDSPVYTDFDGYTRITKTTGLDQLVTRQRSIPNTTNKQLTAIIELRPVANCDLFSFPFYDVATNIGGWGGEYCPSDRFTRIHSKTTTVSANDVDIWVRAHPEAAHSLDLKPVQLFESLQPAIYNNGDSIAERAVDDLASTYFNAYSYLYANHYNVEVEQKATGGDDLTEIEADVAIDLAGASYPVAFLMGGTNDLLVAVSDPTVTMIAKRGSMITAAKVAAESVAVLTVPPTSSYTASQETWRQYYNDNLKSTYANDSQVTIIDVDTVCLDLNGDIITSMYKSTDPVHLNMAAHTAIANLLLAAIPLPASAESYSYAKTTDTGISGIQPARPDNPALDVTNNAIQYPGRIKYNLDIVSGTGPSDWVVKFPQAPQLITILGLNSAYFDASGIPKNITWATHVDTAQVRFGNKGAVVYAEIQSAENIVKIDKIIGN